MTFYEAAVAEQLRTDRESYPPIQSAEEGLLLILDEVADLITLMRKQPTADKASAIHELRQISARCQRFYEDIFDK